MTKSQYKKQLKALNSAHKAAQDKLVQDLGVRLDAIPSPHSGEPLSSKDRLAWRLEHYEFDAGMARERTRFLEEFDKLKESLDG